MTFKEGDEVYHIHRKLHAIVERPGVTTSSDGRPIVNIRWVEGPKKDKNFRAFETSLVPASMRQDVL